jgi:dihydroorotate dehydrogenase
MPDWTYRTLFRAPLFALPFRSARAIAFSGLGMLAKVPGGTLVIDFFGHTAPPRDLAVVVDGIEYCSPVGLGPQLDPQYQALPALARFGVGWVEIDPLLAEVDTKSGPRHVPAEQALHWPLAAELKGPPTPLPHSPALPVPSWLRLGCLTWTQKSEVTANCVQLVKSHGNSVSAVTLNTLGIAVANDWTLDAWRRHVADVLASCGRDERWLPLYVVIPLNLSLDKFQDHLRFAQLDGVQGFLIANTEAAQLISASEQLERCRQRIRELRQQLGNDCTLVATAGIHSPADAIEAWRAGATLVQVDTGLIFAGPGLPKRINEARRFYQVRQTSRPDPLVGISGRGRETSLRSAEARQEPRPPDSPPLPRAVEQAWFWLLLLGLSMGGGGMLAWAIAATRVVLPYDEAYLELTRAQIAAINPRLLLFMAHDRITLAGTMLSIGIFYSFLAWHGVRQGAHWAWLTIVTSALSGFGSFFLFLFFGYFDPFHALVTAIMFQLLMAGWQGKLDSPALPHYPNLSDTWAWKLAQWGQLLFVAQGVALIVAGCVICYVGSTSVFVHEDLEFMRTTRAALLDLHPRLVPVVAHDRASFGGMLIANGLATLLSALWGFRQGDGWQWWMYALAGLLAYGSTLLVHYSVGYSSPMHLAPALLGMLGVVVGLRLSYPYLMGVDVGHHQRWQELLK